MTALLLRTETLDNGPGCLMDYYEWFQKAAHGAILIYWTGDLRYDRDPDNCPADELGARRSGILALDQLARRILADAADGALVLLQRRIEDNVYEYRALRRRVGQGLQDRSASPRQSRRELV